MKFISFINKLVKLVLSNLVYDCRRIVYWLTGNKDYNKFIILTRSRTGSTLLVKLLNSHPLVETQVEPFRRKFWRSSSMIWSRVFSFKPKHIQQVGFKLMYYHDYDLKKNNVWHILQNNREVKVIHLQRRNLLRCLVSREIAFQTNVFHSYQIKNAGTLEKPYIYMKPDDVIQDLELTIQLKQDALNLLKNHQIMKLYYEDFLNNHEKFEEIFKFLNLPKHDLKAYMKKMNPEPLEELVINYSEIYDRLKNTEWAYLLNLP